MLLRIMGEWGLMKQEYITHSAAETEQVGKALAPLLEHVRVLAMYGTLGAGKTALTRGIAAGLGCTDAVSSPTYTIVNEYRGPRRVCHFDMYRIESEDALYDIGWEDYIESGALCVVEWSEHVQQALPSDAAVVRIEKTGEESRKIVVELC